MKRFFFVIFHVTFSKGNKYLKGSWQSVHSWWEKSSVTRVNTTTEPLVSQSSLLQLWFGSDKGQFSRHFGDGFAILICHRYECIWNFFEVKHFRLVERRTDIFAAGRAKINEMVVRALQNSSVVRSGGAVLELKSGWKLICVKTRPPTEGETCGGTFFALDISALIKPRVFRKDLHTPPGSLGWRSSPDWGCWRPACSSGSWSGTLGSCSWWRDPGRGWGACLWWLASGSSDWTERERWWDTQASGTSFRALC